MPTYQYRCRDCGYDFDIVQRFSDDALTQCPQCTGELRKVFSASRVVFKGQGFYSTDNRASGPEKSGSTDASSAGKAGDSAKQAGADSASGAGSSAASSDSSATTS